MKIVTTHWIIPPVADMLRERYSLEECDGRRRAEVLASVAEADGLLVSPAVRVDAELLAAAPRLKVIGTMSAGTDHVDTDACKAAGVKVGYTPHVSTEFQKRDLEAVAELTVGLLLATTRNLLEGNKAVHSGAWGGNDMLWMCGKGLAGSVVGVVGLGYIGASVARKLQAFHPARLLYASPSAKEQGDKLGAEHVELEYLVAQSDVIICCCSLTEQTRGLFGRRLFSLTKPGAVFINITRGSVVDQEALCEALETGRLGAAGLDVTTPEPLPTDHPLLKLPNAVPVGGAKFAVVIPHIGSETVETREAMCRLTAENIVAGLEGKALPAPLC